MSKANEAENNKKEQQTMNESGGGNPIMRSLAGGLIGAAVGYAATPENGKKIMETVSPDKLKNTGSALGQTVKEKSLKALRVNCLITKKVLRQKVIQMSRSQTRSTKQVSNRG